MVSSGDVFHLEKVIIYIFIIVNILNSFSILRIYFGQIILCVMYVGWLLCWLVGMLVG